jgi:hypothetical protein
MSTIKISQLPLVTTFTANTQNTVFVGVDLDADLTGQFTAQAIARNLYLNNTLIVGNNIVQFDNVIGQFSGSSPTYLQINNQNFNANGSADYVASTSDSDNTFGFVDMGIESASYNGVAAGYPAFKPYDGYLYMVGKTTTSPTGNLIIGTQNKANTVFINGGVTNQDIVALMTANGLVLNTQSYITFADGTRQITNAASFNYTTTASAVANNASANSILLQAGLNATNANIAIALAGVEAANANISSGVVAVNANIAFLNAVNLTQNDNITTATTLSQYALGVQTTQNTRIQTAQNQANVAGIVANTTAVVANNALANTTGTFGGTLNISNNLTVNGTVVLANSNFSSTEAAFRITAAGSSQTPTQAGTLMQLTGKANTPARILIDSIGISNTAYSLIAGRTARGTVGAPTATQNNDILLRIAGNSYGTTGYAPFGDARIDFVASENHSDTARGSRIKFWNTPTGSNVVNEIASFNADSVYFTGVVEPQKGFIYTPNIYPSSQTAITIDFANNSVVRAQTAAGLVVTLSSFVTGKVVEAWITNTAGTGQTFTHGCSAINSTINSTTYSIPATSSIFLKYWCMDGTLANTFVAITK